MRATSPLVWKCAEDLAVYDHYGNRWIDWSSGVLVTNAGHGMSEMGQPITCNSHDQNVEFSTYFLPPVTPHQSRLPVFLDDMDEALSHSR